MRILLVDDEEKFVSRLAERMKLRGFDSEWVTNCHEAIAKAEKDNLVSIAATYDKMAPEAAGEILTNMSQAKNSSSDDAVKILHYMTERTKAKVLASIAESKEPAISAYFCQKLKQIIEKE